MNNKKYYSISEVTEILNIRSHQLRYLEKILPNITVHKLRNRRYYTISDIECFRSYIVKNIENIQLTVPIMPLQESGGYNLTQLLEERPQKLSADKIQQINNLIKNFRDLSISIGQVLAN